MAISRRNVNAAPSPGGLGAMQTGVTVSAVSGRGVGATSQWTPTVANLLVILILEIVAFAGLRYAFHVIQGD